MLPIKVLDLPSDLAEDDYGNKLAYIVDSTFTVVTPPSRFTDPSAGTIVINRYASSLAVEEPNAIFAIISYGRNQKGAVAALAIAASAVSSDSDEIENGLASFDANLVSASNRSGTSFDDIVFFKSKKNLLSDAEVQFSLGNNNQTAASKVTLPNCSTGSTLGLNTATVTQTTSATINCNKSGFNPNTLTYSCSAGGTFSVISGTCDCVTGYNLSGSTCVPVTCSSGSTAGLNTTTVNYGIGTKQCNGTNFNTANSINYSCSAAGTFSVTSGSCGCNTGYNLSGSTCVLATCSTGSITGLNTTTVNYGTGTKQCDGTNFNTANSINYNCSAVGTFSVTSGSCGCNTGYNLSGSTCAVVTCSTVSTVGLNTTTVNYGTGTKQCNGTNFNTANSINYNCSAAGTFSVTSGSCGCASGYVLSGSTCVSNALNCTGYSIVGSRKIHTFTAGGILSCTGSTNDFDILVVGGGGSGGDGSGVGAGGGGGGGGQVVQSLNNSVTISGNFSITVGAGATNNNGAGGSSSISGNGISITAYGGGGGGYYNVSPSNGGGGGGGGMAKGAGGSTISQSGGVGTYGGGNGLGTAAIAAGGGGGSSQASGGSASTGAVGAGAAGVSSSVSGSSVVYGAGGGGGGPSSISRGVGGSSCGGNGSWSGTASTNATCRGGGGGGGSGSSNASSDGMTGIVIVSYPQ